VEIQLPAAWEASRTYTVLTVVVDACREHAEELDRRAAALLEVRADLCCLLAIVEAAVFPEAGERERIADAEAAPRTARARDILTARECGRADCPCHLSASRGHGVTHCPVPGHGRGQGDRSPSLRVSEGRDQPLFKCFTGCEPAAVVAALKDRADAPEDGPDGSPAR
jgi:hypothetical protein